MIKNKNLGFLKSTHNLFTRFNLFAIFGLLLVFVFFNFRFWSGDLIQLQQIESVYTYLFLLLFFVAGLSYLYAEEETRRYFKETMSNQGISAVASYFISFYVIALIYSSFEGVTDTEVLYGIFTNKFFLYSYYNVVSYVETFTFCVFLYIVIRKLSKAKAQIHIPSMVWTSILFSLFHIVVYGFNPASLIFAFIMNMIFTYLVWLKKISFIPTLALVLAFHCVYDIAKHGGLSLLGF